MIPSVRTALIICNGEPPSRILACRLARTADLVVAADGGANMARRYGIPPDIIIGDLDSVTRATRRHFSQSLVLQVSRQDNTDLEKALDFVASAGVEAVNVIGATGRRIDFTLGNLSVLWNYTAFMDLRFTGDGWTAIPVGKERVVRAAKGTTVSLIPFGACDGITLRGLQYPLTNAAMGIGEIGVSNVVRSSPFSVRVKRGKILMVILHTNTRSAWPERW
jgi:thiamine pyrophosphokinase